MGGVAELGAAEEDAVGPGRHAALLAAVVVERLHLVELVGRPERDGRLLQHRKRAPGRHLVAQLVLHAVAAAPHEATCCIFLFEPPLNPRLPTRTNQATHQAKTSRDQILNALAALEDLPERGCSSGENSHSRSCRTEKEVMMGPCRCERTLARSSDSWLR